MTAAGHEDGLGAGGGALERGGSGGEGAKGLPWVAEGVGRRSSAPARWISSVAREDDGETENARVQRRGRLGGAGCQGLRREGTMPSTTARGLEQLHDPFRIEGRRGRPRALGEEAEELEIEAPDLKLGRRMD